jgi:hypothetical protein
VFYVSTENQLADIFTKPLDEKTFCRLRSELNVLDLRNLDLFIAYMCFMPWSCSLCTLLFIYGAQVVQTLPGPHKSICKWCTYLGGDVLQLDPLRLTVCLSLLDLVSKVEWKGILDLDHERLPLYSDERVTYSKFIPMSLIAFLLLIDNFVEAMGFKGKKWSRFGAWCKGGAIKGQSNKWISYHLRILKIIENFENNRVRTLVLSKF